MGTSNGRHHQANLAGPVKRALHLAGAEIEQLVRNGPAAYAGLLRTAEAHNPLVVQILDAIADVVERFGEAEP